MFSVRKARAGGRTVPSLSVLLGKTAHVPYRRTSHLSGTFPIMVVACAQRRKESRGLHYTTDYPETLESERHGTTLRRG